jgi:NAD(P)-dependent dehydrogenase (short-subunit alcohol dehydrogenase family)
MADAVPARLDITPPPDHSQHAMNRSNPLDLAGRTLLVTGASSGIGRETAVVLSELRARVIVSGRRKEQLDATLRLMTPGDHAAEPCDLAQLDAIPDWIKSLSGRYGPFHGVIHAAGIQKTIPLRALTVESLHQTFRVNFDSAVMLAKAFRQKGCRDAPSSIVLVSSVAALAGSPATSAYAASKAALIGLTKSLASELAAEGIRVNCIAPGLVQSEMTDQIRATLSQEQFAAVVAQYPLGLGSTWDVACAAAYLLSDASRWMTGHTLVLDGGFSAQ